MSKIFKMIGWFLIIIILILAVAIGTLVLFVSPDRFKPLIIEQVQKTTGRQLIMDGKLSWTVFPYLGVKTGHLSFSNPSTFTQKVFAEVDHATVAVKIMPLLHGQVESNGIVLSGVTLNLIKNAAGQTNWQDLSAPSAATTDHHDDSAAKTSAGAFSFMISNIDVSAVKINWLDEVNKKSLHIFNLDFHAKNISLFKAFPITMQFHFLQPQGASGQFALQGEINAAHQQYQLQNATFTATIQAGNTPLTLKGDVDVDVAQQRINLQHLVATAADLTLTGQVKVLNFSAPRITGSFHMAVARFSQLKMSDVQVKANFQQGVLQLNPVTAQLYQGKLAGETTIRLTESIPHIALKANLTQVDIASLLNDLSLNDRKIKIKGMGNINVDISTMGANQAAILNHLNGTVSLKVSDGIMTGVDVGYWVDTADALVNKQSPTAKNTEATPFGTLTATAALKNGVISNTDLLLDAARLEAKGSGTIDLPAQQIRYTLVASAKQLDKNRQKNDFWHIYGLSVPIQVTGSLQNPAIRLDTSALLKQAVQKEVGQVKEKLQEKIKQQIPDKLQQQLKDKAGSLLQNLLK